MNGEDPDRLLRGDFVLPVDEFVRRAGLGRHDLQTLLAEGLIVGGFDTAGILQAVWLDPLPSVEQLRELGMVPSPGYPDSLREGLFHEAGDQPSED